MARMVPEPPAAWTRTGRLPRAGAMASSARVTVGGGTFFPAAAVVVAPGGARFRFGGREIPGAMTDLDVGPVHFHTNPAEAAIELGIARVIAEEIVRPDVREDLPQRARDVVGVEHDLAIGLQRHHAEIVVTIAEQRGVHRRRQREIRRLVEDDQPARVNRIEADVRAVGPLQQLAELELVIAVAQPRGLAVARFHRLQRAVLEVRAALRSQSPGARIRTDALRPGVGDDFQQTLVRTVEGPAFGEDQHELSFGAKSIQVIDEPLEGIERLLLAKAMDERPRGVAITGVQRLFRRRPRDARSGRVCPRSSCR